MSEIACLFLLWVAHSVNPPISSQRDEAGVSLTCSKDKLLLTQLSPLLEANSMHGNAAFLELLVLKGNSQTILELVI